MNFEGKHIYAEYNKDDKRPMFVLGIYVNGIEIYIIPDKTIIPILTELKEVIKILESELEVIERSRNEK